MIGRMWCLFPALFVFLSFSAFAEITSAGLEVQVPAFDLLPVIFPGGTIEALPGNSTQYLVVNPKTLTLHTLARNFGDGDIELARLTVAGNEVTKIEPIALVSPTTRIPRALEKIRDGKPLRVFCFGSSLVEGGTSKHGWQRRAFDKNYFDHSLNVGSQVHAVNFGVGGTNARYSIALFGTGLENGKALETSAFDCDLAIVALLPNGGEDRDAVFEGVVRMLRSRDLEVLLLTDNSNAGKGIASGLWGGGSLVRQLADRYDCAVADTAAYMLEAEQRGKKVFGDSIHQSPEGHFEWARAVAAALYPYSEVEALAEGALDFTGKSVVTKEDIIPGGIEVDFTPANTGGILNANVRTNPLAGIYGMSSRTRLDLPEGSRLMVSHQTMRAADLVFEVSSSFEAEVREPSGGSLLKTIANQAPEKISARPQIKPVVSAGELQTSGPQTYTLTITSGVLRLYAISYHTP